MIQEAYVSLSTAKLLKEKRFNEPCYSFYEFKNRLYHHQMDTYFPNGMTNADHDKEGNNGIAAPTQQMAMRWIREVHNIKVNVFYNNSNYAIEYFEPNTQTGVDKSVFIGDGYYTYEQACEAAIKYCLENLI